jgi:hypothetical protein
MAFAVAITPQPDDAKAHKMGVPFLHPVRLKIIA